MDAWASPAALRRWAARDRLRRVLRADDRREEADRGRARQTPISELACGRPAVRRWSVERLVLSAWRLDADGVSPLTVELGDWHRFSSHLARARFPRPHPQGEHSSGERRRQGRDHQDRQQPRAPTPDRGRLATTRSPSRRSVTLERRRDGKTTRRCKPQAERSARRLATHAWHALEGPRQAPARSSSSPSRAELAGHCWALATIGVAATIKRLGEESAPALNDARSDPREHCEQPQTGPRSTPEKTATRSSFRTNRSCGHQPRAYESATQTSTTADALPPPNSPRRTGGPTNPCAVGPRRTPYECSADTP